MSSIFDGSSSKYVHRTSFNDKENIENPHQIIKSKDLQLHSLKDQYLSLRSRMHKERQEATIQCVNIQKRIKAAQLRKAELEKELCLLQTGHNQEELEKMAIDVIEQLWSILRNYRAELFDTIQENEQSDDSSSFITHSSSFDVLPPIEEESPPHVIDDEIEQVQVTPSIDQIDSIAYRRTRRQASSKVYYKEPSLRDALTPGDPYTFGIGGIITPQIPDGYTREANVQPRKQRKRKNI